MPVPLSAGNVTSVSEVERVGPEVAHQQRQRVTDLLEHLLVGQIEPGRRPDADLHRAVRGRHHLRQDLETADRHGDITRVR